MKEILENQVQAAGLLFNALPSYVATDKALRLLAQSLRENDFESCLLKTVAINGLLGTNVYAISGMAEHVYKVLNDPRRADDLALVDQLARFGKHKRISFASKYAHFFLDSEQYPIYDQYVLKGIAQHLEVKCVEPNSYADFVSWFKKVEPLCTPSSNTKDLDRYLWLSGMHKHSQKKKDNSGLGKEVLALFANTEPIVKDALSKLNPE